MGIGVSVFLLALGAILAFAVNATVSGIEISTIGIILMVAGAIGLAMTMLIFGRRDRVGTAGVVEDRVVTRERDVY
jgi:Flp pilus assembly protein protease CpaA